METKIYEIIVTKLHNLYRSPLGNKVPKASLFGDANVEIRNETELYCEGVFVKHVEPDFDLNKNHLDEILEALDKNADLITLAEMETAIHNYLEKELGCEIEAIDCEPAFTPNGCDHVKVYYDDKPYAYFRSIHLTFKKEKGEWRVATCAPEVLGIVHDCYAEKQDEDPDYY